MNTMAICFVAAVLGIDVGWERLPNGGTEYVIQLDRQALESLRAGESLGSDIRPEAGEVRAFRITLHAGQLRRESPPPKPKPTTEKPKQTEKTPPSEPSKPWLPMTLTLIGLFASLGANAFLGWLVAGMRRQLSAAHRGS